jgi:hypothetical protein
MTDYQNKKDVASVAEEGSAYYQEQAVERENITWENLVGR